MNKIERYSLRYSPASLRLLHHAECVDQAFSSVGFPFHRSGSMCWHNERSLCDKSPIYHSSEQTTVFNLSSKATMSDF